jgi:hypothetical protein
MFSPGLASALHELGVELRALGQQEAALEPTREAVDIYRTLSQSQIYPLRDMFPSYLAATLDELSANLQALGQQSEAVDAATEAETIRRGFAQKRPSASASR